MEFVHYIIAELSQLLSFNAKSHKTIYYASSNRITLQRKLKMTFGFKQLYSMYRALFFLTSIKSDGKLMGFPRENNPGGRTFGDRCFPPALINFDDFFVVFVIKWSQNFIFFGYHHFPAALMNFDDFFDAKLSPNYIIVV